MVTPPHDEQPFALDTGAPGMSVGYRTGGFEDVEDVARLVHGVYGGDVQKWRGSMSRALSRENNLLVLARCRGGGGRLRQGQRL